MGQRSIRLRLLKGTLFCLALQLSKISYGAEPLFIIQPIRDSDSNRVVDIVPRQAEIFADGKAINNYGISFLKDGVPFEFNKKNIDRYYLKEMKYFFNIWGVKIPCGRSKYRMVLSGTNGQEIKGSAGRRIETIKNISGAVGRISIFPGTLTKFQEVKINEIEAFGQVKVNKKRVPIEVWGFANSLDKARKMADEWKAFIRSTAHFKFIIKRKPGLEAGKKERIITRSQIGSEEIPVVFTYEKIYSRPADETRYRYDLEMAGLKFSGYSSTFYESYRTSSPYQGNITKYRWRANEMDKFNKENHQVRVHFIHNEHYSEWRILKKHPEPYELALDDINTYVPHCEQDRH